MLDRAALIHCLADAFHPGCEVTWPIRHVSMFMAPFRIRHRASTDPETWPGTQLTPAAALAAGGPLYGQSPGSLTRWMAVPWQADTSSCRSGYDLGFGEQYDPYLPTFWPARVPNHVLTEEDYAIVVDESRTPDERQTAFAARANWLRWLAPKKPQYLNDMVANFGKLGVVERRPGPKDGHFPADLLVESEVGFDEPVDPRRRPAPAPRPRGPRPRRRGGRDRLGARRHRRSRRAHHGRVPVQGRAVPARALSEQVDVVVAGGGPAGAVVALTVARAGHRVLLTERKRSRLKIGEALPGAVGPLLRELALWDAFVRDGHLPSYGNRAAWGSSAGRRRLHP